MEIAGPEQGIHRANRIARSIEEFVDEHHPEVGGDVYIPVSEMNTLLTSMNFYQGKNDLQSRRWLDGICAAYPHSNLGRLSLVKRMTGTWVWKWSKGEVAD